MKLRFRNGVPVKTDMLKAINDYFFPLVGFSHKPEKFSYGYGSKSPDGHRLMWAYDRLNQYAEGFAAYLKGLGVNVGEVSLSEWKHCRNGHIVIYPLGYTPTIQDIAGNSFTRDLDAMLDSRIINELSKAEDHRPEKSVQQPETEEAYMERRKKAGQDFIKILDKLNNHRQRATVWTLEEFSKYTHEEIVVILNGLQNSVPDCAICINKEVSSWIKCTDQEPPKGVRILVFEPSQYNDGEIAVGVWEGKKRKTYPEMFICSDEQDEQPGERWFTHWQPLPQNPKKEVTP